MKTLRNSSLILFSAFIMAGNFSYAQGPNKNTGGSGGGPLGGKSQLMLGGGYSIVGFLGSLVEELVTSATDLEVKSSPEFVVNYDYRLAEKFTLGAGYTYQQLKMEYLDTVFQTNGDTTYAFYQGRITRQNVGLRGAIHFTEPDNALDTYAGVRFSMTFWGYKTDNPDPYNNVEADIDEVFGEGKPRIQVFLGTRYYFNDFIGVGGELAIGNPYFLAIGVNLKF
jgi:hypothetical protein